MRRNIIFILLVFFIFKQAIYSQNLVPNSSFEDYVPCANNIYPPPPPPFCYSTCKNGSLPAPVYWINSGTLYWKAANRTLVDYFNLCNYSNNLDPNKAYWYKPHQGNAFIMIFTYGTYNDQNHPEIRNYATVPLIQPLESGCRYEVSFYVKRACDKYGIGGIPEILSGIATDGIGAYLSSDSICDQSANPNPLYNIIPQVENPKGHLLFDSINYQKISGIITAIGNEKYLTIGNFRDNAHTLTSRNVPLGNRGGLYFIDDISVLNSEPKITISHGENLKICKDSSLYVKASDGFDNYVWSTGETAQQIKLMTEGKYWVKGDYGCVSSTDTINVSLQIPYTEKLKIDGDTFLCDDPKINGYEINTNNIYENYLWSNGDKSNKTKIFKEGVYSVKASYTCGIDSGSIQIKVYNPPNSLISPSIKDTTICLGSTITLSCITGFSNFLWVPLVGYDSLIEVNQAGFYYLLALSKEGCYVRDSIKINVINRPSISLGKDITGCDGLAMNIKANVKFEEYFKWDDGAKNLTKQISSSGVYWAEASNTCDRVTDTIKVNLLDCTIQIPNLITANEDGQNDTFEIITTISRPVTIQIYNRWGEKVFEEDDYLNEWGDQVDAGIYFYHVYDKMVNKFYNGWVEVKKK